MSNTKNFAIDVSQRLPDQDMHGNGDIVTIIEMLIPVIIPLIERCFEAPPTSFGAGCQHLAKEATSNRWKNFAFRVGMLRELGWREYRDLPGGGRDFCQALIESAANADTATLDAIHTECCCC